MTGVAVRRRGAAGGSGYDRATVIAVAAATAGESAPWHGSSWTCFLLSHRVISCHISVLLAASSSLFTVEAMTLPDLDPEAVRQGRPGTDRLISVGDIRALFKLGRTAAYELTRRPGFPAPVQVSRRCLRWWASEVDAYADALQRQGAQRRTLRTATPQPDRPAAPPRRITGTVRVARGRRESA